MQDDHNIREQLIRELRYELALIQLELALPLRARAFEAKYNPTWAQQPRAPRGSSNGGQWVGYGGGGSDVGTQKQPKQQAPRRPRRIDLTQHERSPSRPNGGHAIRDHVAKPYRTLLDRIRNARVVRIGRGNFRLVYRHPAFAGSFTSLSEANRLVELALSSDPDVAAVARGQLRGNTRIFARVGAITGYEAYYDDRANVPRIRNTYGVEVVIRHDPNAAEGFVIRTAYPANLDPSRPYITLR